MFHYICDIYLSFNGLLRDSLLPFGQLFCIISSQNGHDFHQSFCISSCLSLEIINIEFCAVQYGEYMKIALEQDVIFQMNAS